MTQLDGGCLCGKIRYRVSPEPGDVADYCHCTQCRRASGAPLTAWLQLPPWRFHLTAGRPKSFSSSAHSTRFFCPDCGSQLYMTDQAGRSVGITLGTLDAPEDVRPTVHGWTKHLLSWLNIVDNLPRYDDFPPYDL
jgi:hypothetical protein